MKCINSCSCCKCDFIMNPCLACAQAGLGCAMAHPTFSQLSHVGSRGLRASSHHAAPHTPRIVLCRLTPYGTVPHTAPRHTTAMLSSDAITSTHCRPHPASHREPRLAWHTLGCRRVPGRINPLRRALPAHHVLLGPRMHGGRTGAGSTPMVC